MKVVIEFYRTRDADEARALIGREFKDAGDLDDAIATARLMAEVLEMPQRPDAMSIATASGKVLYFGVIGAQAANDIEEAP